jgi:hypothetical protein
MGNEINLNQGDNFVLAPKKVHIVAKTRIASSRLTEPSKEFSKLLHELTPKEIRVEAYNVKHLRRDAVKLLQHTFESVMSGDDRLKKHANNKLTLGEIVEIGDILQESA